jgi:hypothetical protein
MLLRRQRIVCHVSEGFGFAGITYRIINKIQFFYANLQWFKILEQE